MSLNIIRQGVELERVAGEDKSQLLLRVDVPLQGVGRSDVEILMEDARVEIENIEVQNDRIIVGGQAHCQAVYRVDDDAELLSVSGESTFEQVIDIPGSGAKMTAQVDSTVEHVDTSYENGRLSFQISVLIKARVLDLAAAEPVSDIEGVDGIERSSSELRSYKLSAEAESSVLLRDEVSLPSALDAKKVLIFWATPKIAAAERDLGGARVAGEVAFETLISSGVDGRPLALVKDTLAFDELIEFPDWLTGELDASACVKALDVSLESDGGEHDSIMRISCELKIGVRIFSGEGFTVLKDAYGTQGTDVALTRESAEICGGVVKSESQELFRSVMLLPDGAPGVGTVLAVRAWPSISEWTAEAGITTVVGVMETTVLYMPGGSDKLSSVKSELPFTTRLEGEYSQNAWVDVAASEAEAAAIMSDRLELKCSLKTIACDRLDGSVELISDVADTQAAARKYGISVAYPAAGDTLWSIGKKYSIPMSQVEELAVGEGGLAGGKPIVIVTRAAKPA